MAVAVLHLNPDTELLEQLELANARRDRAVSLLEQLLAIVPQSAFASPAAQASICGAEALLAELGRGQPERFAGANAAWLAAREAK